MSNWSEDRRYVLDALQRNDKQHATLDQQMLKVIEQNAMLLERTEGLRRRTVLWGSLAAAIVSAIGGIVIALMG